MSSRTSSLIGGLPPTEVRRKLHFLRTSSQCQRRSVCGVQERQPPGSRKDPAHRGHEHTVATAKKRPPRLPPEDHQLVAKDHHFDLPIEVAGRASYQPNDTAQQQIHESNEHGPTSHEKNAR